MNARYILVQVKGDWCELSNTLGFPTWSCEFAPCFLCACTKTTMYDFSNITLQNTNWGKRTESYEESCFSHETQVDVASEDIREAILETGKLHLAKNRKPMGRILASDIPGLKLQAGDRLDPSVGLNNTDDFETADLPFTCVFWRPRFDALKRIHSWILRRNPLFHHELGTTPDTVLHLDTLHTLYLGVFGTFVLNVILAAIAANVYNVVGPIDVVRAVSIKRIFSDYKAWARENNIELSYQLGSLSPSMVYSKKAGHYELKTKAAETGVLLLWAADFCKRRGADAVDFPNKSTFAAAGSCLLDYMAIIRGSGVVVPRDDCHRLMFLCLRHLALMEEAGVRHLPKSHMFIHVTQRIPEQGNPRFYSTFLDESLNLVIANMAAASHRSTWEVSVFQRARLLPLVTKNSAFACV